MTSAKQPRQVDQEMMHVELSVRLASGEQAEKVLKETSRVITFGRDPECDVDFDDESGALVSWRHATLHWDKNWIVNDLDSTNGTFVKGKRIGENGVNVSQGDHFTLGKAGPEIRLKRIECLAVTSQPADESGTGDAHEGSSLADFKKHGIAIGVSLISLIVLAWIASNWSDRVNDSGSMTISASAAQRNVDRLESLSETEVIQLHRSHLAWVGVRVAEEVLPYCSGIRISPGKTVVTTDRGNDLRLLHVEESLPLVSGNSSNLISATDCELAQEDDSQQVGYITLVNQADTDGGNLIGNVFTSYLSTDREHFEVGARVYVVGYLKRKSSEDSMAISAKAIRATLGELENGQIERADFDRFGLRLDAGSNDLMFDGAMVCDIEGGILGIAEQRDDVSYCLVPSSWKNKAFGKNKSQQKNSNDL